MPGSKLVGIVRKKIRLILTIIIAVMHDKWCKQSIPDLNGCLITGNCLLNGKACHAAKKLLQGLLTGYEVAERIIDQHIVAFIICKISIRL